MSTLTPPRPRSLLEHHPHGASTGYMLQTRGDWAAQVAIATELSPAAVELSVLSEAEVEGLQRYLHGEPALPFRYVSIHGPSKGRQMSERQLAEMLHEIARGAHAIVLHPDTIVDAGPYETLGTKLVLENMDARKQDGRTVEELSSWFQRLPDAGFCFDIAHAHSLDHSMGIAEELLDAFRGRLRHLHVSSLDENSSHAPLSEEDEALFAPLLNRCRDVPWILEAPPRRSR
jgi:sugar phosphate isomerase/epimerase